MKKAMALFLTLLLAGMLQVQALGAETQQADVTGTYQNQAPAVVYSVDVAWGEMAFTYSENTQAQWNEDSHMYEALVSSACWEAEGNGVTVTNHSNAPVTAAFQFEALEAFETLTGSFDVAQQELAAGVVDGYEKADSVTACLSLEGSLGRDVREYTKIGTITVVIQ